jgi:hypothetical protein
MCFICDGIAPQCAHATRSDWGNYCAGWAAVVCGVSVGAEDLEDSQSDLDPGFGPAGCAEAAAPTRAGPRDRCEYGNARPQTWSHRNRAVHWDSLSKRLTYTGAPPAGGPEPKKELRAESIRWLEPGEAHCGDTEVLFMAMLVANLGTSVADLSEWATKLLLERAAATQLKETWQPSSAWPASSRGSTAFGYAELAMGSSYSDVELDQFGAAIEAWPHAGQADSLRHGQLRQFLRKDKKQAPKGVRRTKKAEAPLRWRTWQVCDVAYLVKYHGPALRRARDFEPSEVKSSVVRLAESASRIVELEETVGESLAETSEALAKAKTSANAQEKAAARNKEKTMVKTSAISKLRSYYQDKMRNLKDTVKTLFETEYDAKANELEAEFDETLACEARKLAVARKRARDVEVAARRATKYLARARKAEKLVKELETIEEEEEEESEEEDAEPTSAHRDKRGRFLFEGWRMRWIRCAQLGLGLGLG